MNKIFFILGLLVFSSCGKQALADRDDYDDDRDDHYHHDRRYDRDDDRDGHWWWP